jgi:hypothetical protein
MRVMFNECKATQAAARLLKSAGGAMNYMVLVKMLYMADRQTLMDWGRPITGDDYFTMKLGPVLSRVHDLITEEQPPEEFHPWTQSITRAKWDVALIGEPGDQELSEAEEAVLDNVFNRFKIYLNDPFGFPRWIHRHLREVKEITEGRIPLKLSEILSAGDKSAEEISTVLSELQMLETMDAMLTAHH